MTKLQLTSAQKQFIDENCNKILDLIELTRATFMNDQLDGRTKEGRAVREYLVEQGTTYRTREHQKVKKTKYTQEQIEFILSSAEQKMRPFEIAQLIFPDKHLYPLSKEVIDINDNIRDHAPEQVSPEDSALGNVYRPPDNLEDITKKVNAVTTQELNPQTMSMHKRKCVEMVGKFIQSPRFSQVINNYSNQDDRDLFEAEFIRATWDKPDLTSDEVNLYINVCIDYVNLKNIQGAVDKLNGMFNDAEEQQDLTVRLAEILKTKSEEYNQCEKRMESLISKLNGDRAKRISSRVQENASILSLVEMFQTEEEREVMVKIAEMQKATIKEEADRLESMPEWKARVLGIGKDDII